MKNQNYSHQMKNQNYSHIYKYINIRITQFQMPHSPITQQIQHSGLQSCFQDYCLTMKIHNTERGPEPILHLSNGLEGEQSNFSALSTSSFVIPNYATTEVSVQLNNTNTHRACILKIRHLTLGLRSFENVQQVQSSLHTYFCMFPIYVCIMN